MVEVAAAIAEVAATVAKDVRVEEARAPDPAIFEGGTFRSRSSPQYKSKDIPTLRFKMLS